ncbi:alpha/beta fold hydrolase [Nocardioides marmoraquaticus]
MPGYRDWLIAQLRAFAAPVDLIGHDWGGVHVLNAVMKRPDLVRSWVTDSAAVFHPRYEWHSLARTWQTPGEGEDLVASMIIPPLTDRTAAMHDLGISSPVAERLAAALDEQMGRAILTLDRSATQPAMAQAGRYLPTATTRRGLILHASDDDMTGTKAMCHDVADASGAEVATLDGVGHWWMVQDPDQAAYALGAFWDRLT